MGRIQTLIRKIVDKINGVEKNKNLSFDQKVESGLIDFFHGNNRVRNFTIGINSYVSFNSIIYHTDIGNYCSIGPNVVIGYGDHPTDNLSTSPLIYLNEIIYDRQEIDSRLISHFNKVTILNDVWIGANVYIKNGVKIGNGAIIGAGAVVLKDVQDYEIVVGVPAQPIKKRFSDEIINKLLELKWWEKQPKDLTIFKDVLTSPTEDGLSEMISYFKNAR